MQQLSEGSQEKLSQHADTMVAIFDQLNNIRQISPGCVDAEQLYAPCERIARLYTSAVSNELYSIFKELANRRMSLPAIRRISLLPDDVGFDLRSTKQPVMLPKGHFSVAFLKDEQPVLLTSIPGTVFVSQVRTRLTAAGYILAGDSMLEGEVNYIPQEEQ